jgi:hypothetical protein
MFNESNPFLIHQFHLILPISPKLIFLTRGLGHVFQIINAWKFHWYYKKFQRLWFVDDV